MWLPLATRSICAAASIITPRPSQRLAVDAIHLNKSGAKGKPIRYWAYPGEKPVFDFFQMKDDCRIKGFHVSGDYIHLKGLEIRGVPQINNLNHESWGVWITGSHNVFEQLDIHHIMGAGLFINNGVYNLVLNSDSHHNYDPFTSNGAGESGDGFGGHPKANMPGNVFRGCRAWWNSDDGFDLINAWSSVHIEDSCAWHNGYLPDTMTPSTSTDFEAVSMVGWDAPRKKDGSLPILPLMRLKAGSDLVDAGIDVGLKYKGRAPDLGAFER